MADFTWTVPSGMQAVTPSGLVIARNADLTAVQQVAAVVHELVDVHTLEHRGGALFGAAAVQRQHQQQAAENGPGQQFAQRDDGNGNAGFGVGG